MKKFLPLLFAISDVTGLNLRRSTRTSDFGCTDKNGPCISPNLIGAPDKLSASTISTSINQAGFVMANAVEGDDGRDGDPGQPREPDEDPAAQYMIVAPVLDMPPPLPGLIHCQQIEECTTSTTTIPPGA